MRCLFASATPRCSNRALKKFLEVPLRPMDLRDMKGNDRQHIRAAVEQLTARTARSYRAFASQILKRNLDRETAAQLVPLESICKSEFERCVALTEMVDPYLQQPESDKVCDVGSTLSSEISDGEGVDKALEFSEDAQDSVQTRFIDLLEGLRPRENLLDVAVNEKCINSPDVNYWIYCFCRRRVSWRVIHEHLLHLVGPGRFGPVIRVDPCVASLLQHAGMVVIDLYTRVVQAAHGGSLAITVEERPNLFTTLPAGQLATSSITVSPTARPGCGPQAQPSDVVRSVEGHLAYVFREIIKNACVALMSKATDMELKVYFATNDTHVIVDVVDTADGVSLEVAGKFWQFGWSTNTSLCQLISGFGLGLPVSKVYMDLWNGRIDIYTTPGSGTTVRVTFPKAPVEVLLPEMSAPW
ncbi:Histidine kinase-, DNA gyrase B-, and HSP90-like ATPase, putative [Trypanosoma equiperdum]|uniref:Protein-serine/threonine kinase n=3 Tax=Trypanozoon TaxID=39700 RepID=Q580B2_TRYB2|nr:hypothetical protein, conserved [Trypanosoma brucei brucei TREU927]AAX80935.1 hypothetical protein, conserved [Trypanosoma brucei]AAZ10675.1 hypothetical protein, conserved [Trypanosoma brucei brucei TREU927]RHW73045.1 Histidine kinase [Trypanosoma brucei equiperdum]SCU71079.1 Histidine kinase-, DNA gyrase B-, and HSP90-like ATPase, putative [Trypanosoma equiperdum]